MQLLTPNPYSRPQKALEKVNGIVVHYTANPGTSARQNRDYFNGLAETKKTKASSHFVIGLEGEIVQCIPCNEISYASNNRNSDTISIECCIEDETGKFNDSTYQSLIELTTWLMGRYDLNAVSFSICFALSLSYLFVLVHLIIPGHLFCVLLYNYSKLL